MKVKVTQLCSTLWPHGLYSPWNSPGQNTGVGSFSLLPGISPTQGSNPGLPYCRRILYQLSHKGRPRILDWVAYSVFSRSSRPRNRTRVSCIAGGFFTNWAIREAPIRVAIVHLGIKPSTLALLAPFSNQLVAQLVKNLPAMWENWVGKIPWRREGLLTPVFWPREFHGMYSPWGRKELDTTEWLSLSLKNSFSI